MWQLPASQCTLAATAVHHCDTSIHTAVAAETSRHQLDAVQVMATFMWLSNAHQATPASATLHEPTAAVLTGAHLFLLLLPLWVLLP